MKQFGNFKHTWWTITFVFDMKPSVLPGCQCLQKDISGVWILSHQRMHPKIHWHELSFFGQLDTVQTCMRRCRMSTQTWWNITQILFSHMKHSLLPVCSVSRRLSKEFWSCQINVYIKKEKIWKDQIWWPVAVFCKLSGLLQNRHEAQNSLTIQKVKKNGESLVTGSARSRDNKSVISRIFVD